MTEKKHKTEERFLERLVSEDRELMKCLMKEALEEILEAEMTEMIGVPPSERSEGRLGYLRAIIPAV